MKHRSPQGIANNHRYRLARGRALTRLARQHWSEFQALLEEERGKLPSVLPSELTPAERELVEMYGI